MTENLFGIIDIEAMTAAQGVELRAPLITSDELQKALAVLRTSVPPLEEGRYMARDLAVASRLVADGTLAASISTGLLPTLES